MQNRTLGTDLSVSAVGLGCMGFSHGYGLPTEAGETETLLRRAVDLGYTFFDTAEVYGTQTDPHANETLVGQALAPVRDQVVLSTKFGLTFDFASGKTPLPIVPDSRPETILRSVEGSLRRLGTDHIDLYFQHRTDPGVEPEAVAQVMADLIREGKITHWGISEATEDYLRRAHAVCPVTAVQNRYSMMA
ncbi:MAG TPA: aldo/keto reductase, partial [Candidatus Evtepia excrementipullorum]|nr:aldo/keto reductase [Candidatus Evtepia excrementipullorum]